MFDVAALGFVAFMGFLVIGVICFGAWFINVCNRDGLFYLGKGRNDV